MVGLGHDRWRRRRGMFLTTLLSGFLSFFLSSSLIPQADCLNDADWLTLTTQRAHTLSTYKQLLTSSTLSWARIEDLLSGRIPTSSLVLVEGSAVCRVKDGNRQRAGRTDHSGSCIAGHDWVKHINYQVLVDPFGLSRYSWQYWDMFTQPQIGTVAYNSETFVASFSRANGDTIIGELDFNRGLNGNIKAFVDENQTELSVEGKALVEIEPTRYRLENVRLVDTRRPLKEKPLVLGKTTLERPGGEGADWARVNQTIRFNYPGYFELGHTPGTVKGLPSSATLYNTTVQFSWGIAWKKEQDGEKNIYTELQPGTSQTVTLMGVIKSGDGVPLRGRLVQEYGDGYTSSQDIKGTLSLSLLAETHVKYGTAYYTKTGEAAPLRPTSTSPPTTTTTPAAADMSSSTDTPASPPPPPSLPTASFQHKLKENKDGGASAVTAADGQYSSLFPPEPEPSTTENPLRRFYPLEDDKKWAAVDHVVASGRVYSSAAAPGSLKAHYVLVVVAFLKLYGYA